MLYTSTLDIELKKGLWIVFQASVTLQQQQEVCLVSLSQQVMSSDPTEMPETLNNI